MSAETAVRYPVNYETEAVLRDGARVLLRPIRLDDTDRWLAFVRRLSLRSLYLRFHNLPKLNEEDAIRFCTVDYHNTFAIVAEIRKGNVREIVAIGRYYLLPNKHSAEVAFAIEDRYQGRGIGTKLVESLANVAREKKITIFEADVMAENKEMLTVFRDYGFHLASELDGGVYHITFRIARTKRVEKKEEARELTATVASMQSVMMPKSVAVIGASKSPLAIGHLIFRYIIDGDFKGVVYPIHPTADSIKGVKAYPTILDVPGPVEQAVIVVPVSSVSRVVDECGRKGVKSVVVISDGFRERGEEGAARERELREISLGHGMRLVGPNCMGIINTDPAVSFNGTFSRTFPPRGNVAFLSQSGGMGLVILEYATNLNLGISSFVSVGNRADVSFGDLLKYWEQDPATKVILLYLESFGSARQFTRIARRVSAAKPILAVKGGRTTAGLKAASSHTGAMATSSVVGEALFRQAGIIRMNSVEELLDNAMLFSNQPLPKGRRVVVVTNSGGPGIIAADACYENNLILQPFSAETAAALKKVIPRDIPLNNPLDMTAGAGRAEFEGALRVLVEDSNTDAVLTIFVPPVVVDTVEVAEALRRAAPLYQRRGKPLLGCFMGQKGVQGKFGSGNQYVPCYLFPEQAVAVLARAADYAEESRRPRGVIPKLSGVRRGEARRIVCDALIRSIRRPFWMLPDEIIRLLGCYGIRTVPSVTTSSAARAAEQAERMGFPVAIKLHSSTITHKSDMGGVILDVKSKEEVKRAFADIRANLATMGKKRRWKASLSRR